MLSLTYIITPLDIQHLHEALQLIWEVFLEFEAPDYNDEGVNEFKEYIEFGSIMEKLDNNEIKIWTCLYNNEIKGVIALRIPCHISLLFVRKEHHKKGIARSLFNEVLAYCKGSAQNEITVNSSPYAKEVYHKLGFKKTNDELTVNGIRFIPMRYEIISF